jgi:hypothetical protein
MLLQCQCQSDQIVYWRKFDAALKQNCLQAFLNRLLRKKAG